jgi:putative addiction module antidote
VQHAARLHELRVFHTFEAAMQYYERNNKTIMHTLKFTQIGNSVGAIFPKELLARLRLEKGDEFYVTEPPEGLRITPHNAEFEAQMRMTREIMKERRAVLRELAK